MGGSNSKLQNILNKYNPENYFKIEYDRTVKCKNINYLKKNDKLYLLLFEDYLIITDVYGNEKFNILYYKIKSWSHNTKINLFIITLTSNYSETLLIDTLYFYCYKNNTKKIVDCLHDKTINLLEYTQSLY